MIIYKFINSSMKNSDDEISDLNYLKAMMDFFSFHFLSLFFLNAQTTVLNLGHSNSNTLSKVEIYI